MCDESQNQQSMTFAEKLRRLTEGKNRSALSLRAGLSKSAINDYLKRGYVPRADHAASLARVLEVSLDWLCDDAQDWPPFAPGTVPIEAVMADVGDAARPLLHAFVDRLQGDSVFLAIEALSKIVRRANSNHSAQCGVVAGEREGATRTPASSPAPAAESRFSYADLLDQSEADEAAAAATEGKAR